MKTGKRSIEEHSSALINYLALVLKTVQIHNLNNVAVTNAVHKLIELANPILSEESITIQLMGEHFYVNDSRVRYPLEYISNFDFLIREFQKRGLGTVVFEDVLQEDDIKALAEAMTRSGSSETPFETLLDELEHVDNLSIRELIEVRRDISDFEKKRIIKKSYSNAIAIMKGVMDKVGLNKKINFARSKRVIGTIVDHIVEEELQSTLIGLTTIKDYDEYTYYHSVNVSILSIALGNRIGLRRKVLAELGLAALFHDIGKVEIPHEVLNKPAKLSDEDWTLMRQHPWQGAAKILEFRGVNKTSINIAIAAFEHHLNYDLSGYPPIENKLSLDLFTKIISIADHYDAITSSRVYSRTAYPPDDALSIMYGLSGNQLDPCLLKVFIQMIGVYPIGCLVMLNTNEMGLVLENNTDQDFIDRPVVLLISDSSGRKIDGVTASLMEKDERGGYRRTITKTLDPGRYGINLSEYLL